MTILPFEVGWIVYFEDKMLTCRSITGSTIGIVFIVCGVIVGTSGGSTSVTIRCTSSKWTRVLVVTIVVVGWWYWGVTIPTSRVTVGTTYGTSSCIIVGTTTGSTVWTSTVVVARTIRSDKWNMCTVSTCKSRYWLHVFQTPRLIYCRWEGSVFIFCRPKIEDQYANTV